MKILIADDTQIARDYLFEALDLLGHQAEVVSDGPAALAAAKAQAFDLLLLDMRMPILFGDQVLRALRADPSAQSQHAPAIMLSSEMTPSLRSEMLKQGFLEALLKPVALAELEQWLERVSRSGAERIAKFAVLDRALAAERLGSFAAAERMQLAFKQELRDQWPSLQADIAAFRFQAIRELLHQWRASAAICGALELADHIERTRAACIVQSKADLTAAGLELEQGIERVLQWQANSAG
jgi:CheY-like chemotaxis protein